MHAGDVWWTDANGLHMIPRRRSWRRSWPLNNTEPVSGNFYPFTSAATIRGTTPLHPNPSMHAPSSVCKYVMPDSERKYVMHGTHALIEEPVEQEVTLVTDRAQGVASLQSGSMHVLLHRRLLQVCFGMSFESTLMPQNNQDSAISRENFLVHVHKQVAMLAL